jgi:hypothetical protein
VGAALGSLCKRRGIAFVAGVLSHLVTDVLPHKDYKPAVEVPMLAATLVAIAKWRGVDSPEFWGAVGGVAPDVEHGLLVAGVIGKEHELFPTHVDDGKWHGPDSNERWSQLLLAAAAALTLAIRK